MIENNSSIIRWINLHTRGYRHRKFWRRRGFVTDPSRKGCMFYKLYCYSYVRRTEAKNMASLGTGWGCGAEFLDTPVLPHQIKGIIISKNAVIGKHCTIYQGVNIIEISGRAAVIGDDCMIGAGAILVGAVKIGNRAKIGAGAVVVNDVPDDAVAVGNPAVIKESRSSRCSQV